MRLTSLPQFARNANRVREILTVLGKYGLADWLSRFDFELARGVFRVADRAGLTALSHETRIRLALTELGTTFIKFGQMLSTRADLVGTLVANELALLQADTPADSPEVVRATVILELGQPPNELFAEFDEHPLASASIGQVHRARLHGGEPVVVKVQHAGIEHRVRNDLDILIGLAQLAEQYSPELRTYRPRALAVEFQRMLLRELDFSREQRNLQEFARHFLRDGSVHFPVPFPKLSTSRVLTMEALDGIPLSQPARLKEKGYDLEDIARRGARLFLDMIFRDGFYHADPHPGNLLVLEGGILGVIDCGMVGRLDQTLREQIEELFGALAQNDAPRLTATLMRMSTLPAELEQAEFRHDVADFLANYSNQPLDQLNLGDVLTEMTEMIRRYRIALPTNVAMLIKVLIMLEGTSRQLHPQFALTELIRPYYHKLLWRRLSPARALQKITLLYDQLRYFADAVPRTLIDIMQQVQAGRFNVHLEHRRLEPSVNRLVLGMLTSALFLGSSQLTSSKVPPLISDVSLPGALGCGVSVALGLRLLWAIRNSGHLDP
jgi:ubiquinone biosynthesis protein